MGLYIKRMEMPKDCNECDDTMLRMVIGCCCFSTTYRHPDCPLIEIPTPHGRLIDADELESKMLKTYRYFNVKFDLAEAETVIEREM